jgi:cbb3-type cytochrome c oxidase subunit III
LKALRRGQAAFEQYDCLDCHKLDGRGGTLRPGGSGMEGPDLSRIGAAGYKADWYEKHLEKQKSAADGPWKFAFGVVSESDRKNLAIYLDSRVGAPKLVEAKALFHSLGCRGCHKVGGVGGDDGPDLTAAGERDPGQTNFTHVPGERSLANWWAEHFRSPAAVVPGSAMPALGTSEEDIHLLTHYVFSLRRGKFPEAFWPKDRIRAERFGEREFATDGATLYTSFCSACHGPSGEGMRYPGMPSFPAIGNPDFLDIASDDFIASAVKQGRPGRRMPAWGEKDGGLRPAEVDAVVAHVRTLNNVERLEDGKPRLWVRGDRAKGSAIYARSCASCHGDKGQGAEGPALHNKVLLASASDTYLFETVRRGRRGTSMEAYSRPSTTRTALSDSEIESVVAFVRGWEEGDKK